MHTRESESWSSGALFTYFMTPVKTYFFNPIKNYLIGDLNILFTAENENMIFSNVENREGIRQAHFGLFGQIYQINPNPYKAENQAKFNYDIASALNELDQQENGRTSYQILNQFTDGIHPFASTDAFALSFRRLFIQYLNKTEKFSQLASEITTEMIKDKRDEEINVHQTIYFIVYRIIAKVFFGLDELPSDTVEIMDSFNVASFSTKNLFLPKLSFLDKKSREAKSNFQRFSKQLIERQIPIIFDILQSENALVKGQNFFVDLMIDLIKERKPQYKKNTNELKKLLKNLDEQEILHHLSDVCMKAVPSIFMALDNISYVIQRFVLDCGRHPSMQLRIIKEYILLDLENESKGKIWIFNHLDDLKDYYLQYLDSALIRRKPLAAVRFAKDGIKIKDNKNQDFFDIPPNSLILFKLSDAARYEAKSLVRNSLFSLKDHRRSCPGFKLAEILFRNICGTLALSSFEIQKSKNLKNVYLRYKLSKSFQAREMDHSKEACKIIRL